MDEGNYQAPQRIDDGHCGGQFGESVGDHDDHPKQQVDDGVDDACPDHQGDPDIKQFLKGARINNRHRSIIQILKETPFQIFFIYFFT